MTEHDDSALRDRIQELARRCQADPLPIGNLLDLAHTRCARSVKVLPRRHLAACVALALAVATLLVGNIVTATAEPSEVPGQPLPASTTPPAPGAFTPVATLEPERSGPPRTLWLASDPSGRSQGCVSLTQGTDSPPSQLPNVPSESQLPNTFCAFAEDRYGHLPLGYVDSLDSIKAHRAGAGTVLAYGFVPSSAVNVKLHMKKSGLVLLRLLRPSATVTARLYGATLGLPIKAWTGPDLSGFTVSRIEALDGEGKVVADLSF